MTTALKKQEDRYLRLSKDFDPKKHPGLSAVDLSKMNPGPDITRSWALSQDTRTEIKKRDTGQILCHGSACGEDGTGTIRHIRPKNGIVGFVGFVVTNMDGGKVCLKTRGSVVLHITMVSEEDIGRPVYAVGPDSFALEKTASAHEIGRIRWIERENAAVVAFKAHDDTSEPLELKV